MDLRGVPVFPLNTVLYPGTRIPLRIFEPRYHAMLERVLHEEDPVFVVAMTEDPEVGGPASPARVGCLARIAQASPPGDVRFILVTGETRVHLADVRADAPYLEADATAIPDEEGDGAVAAAREVRRVIDRFLPVLDLVADEIREDPVAFSYQVAATLPVDLGVRQDLLEAPDATTRLRAACRHLARLAPELERALLARNAHWN